jgi:hypothetical protein
LIQLDDFFCIVFFRLSLSQKNYSDIASSDIGFVLDFTKNEFGFVVDE